MINTNFNSSSNTTFIFAILVIASGDVSFVTNDITFGEVATYYPNQEVIYMPHFQLEDDDVLNYCGEEFTSFEALVEQYGYDALNETLIINYLGM